MNEQRLQTYLNDHLALIVGERELAERVASENPGDLGAWLETLAVDLEAQKSVLRDLLARLGGGESSLKQNFAWLAEKAGRLKLNDSLTEYSPLSRLVELEALASAAGQRVALWENLERLVEQEATATPLPLEGLRERSEEQLARLHEFRRDAAPLALA